jgi:NADH-quinone oxidoreductase subunit N
LIIKMGAFPFYYWVPRVMAGISWFTCLILLTWQKVAPLFTITTLLSIQNRYILLGLICFSAVGSTLIGGLGGVNQRQLRALIAYSSIGHLGWILFSLTINSWLIILYFIIYICVSITVFVPLIRINLKRIKFLRRIYINKYILFGIFTSLLSLGRVPPLLGFISKWVVIIYCVNSAYYIILAIIIIGSLLSLFYYIRLVFRLCMNFIKYNSIRRIWLFSSIIYYWFSFIINILGGCFFLLVRILN